jgi:flagellin-like protein
VTTPFSFYSTNRVKILRYISVRPSKGSNRQRRGVSPVIATTIILAVTISLGLALWGFANSGIGNAMVQYSEAVNEYGDIVRNHRYVIANMDFDNPAATPPSHMSFWIYNNGKVETTISEAHLIVTCKDCSAAFDPSPTGLTQVDPDDATQPLTVFSKKLKKFHFDTLTTLEPGRTYELTIVSDAGLVQTYVKKSD